MSVAFHPGRRVIETNCTVDIEQTPEFLHAHVELDGIEPGPGDEVIVIDAPTSVAFGERQVFRRKALIMRASPWERFMAKVQGYRELTELFEVGFSEGSAL